MLTSFAPVTVCKPRIHSALKPNLRCVRSGPSRFAREGECFDSQCFDHDFCSAHYHRLSGGHASSSTFLSFVCHTERRYANNRRLCCSSPNPDLRIGSYELDARSCISSGTRSVGEPQEHDCCGYRRHNNGRRRHPTFWVPSTSSIIYRDRRGADEF